MESISKWIFSTFNFPLVNASEDELVDPQATLREQCTSGQCSAFEKKLNECTTRVRSKKKTAETCNEEFLDFIECVDGCVAQTLFSKLK